MKPLPPKPVLILITASCCAIPATSDAAGYPKEGPFSTVECLVAEGPRVESPTGITYGSIVSHSVARAPTDSQTPLEEYGAHCVGYYVEEKSGKGLAAGICEQTDADGDKWVMRFRDEGNQMVGQFEFVAGTGKYVDARITGQFRPAGPAFFVVNGRLQRCMHVTGTYRLKH